MVTFLVLDHFGVAGFRGGFALTAVVLVVGVGAVAWVLLRGTDQRRLWMLSVALVGLVLSSVLVERAPLSKGRLRDLADDVDLPFHRLESERALGNSRCSPCPRLVQRYQGPDLIVEAAVIEVAASLAAAGYPLTITPEARRTGELSTGTEDVAVDASVVREQGKGTTLELTFRSR